MEIKKFSSGGKWEEVFGYSRAIRVGNRVMVTGTTAVDPSGVVIGGDGDAYRQTIYTFQKIKKHLEDAGASIENVVWNRMFVTDISKWEDIARAHSEVFGKIRPCATMIEIKRLILPEMLIEIETEAIIP
jgi:enamine deaminase RidA (YjgF/YER057c/UK114 family)